MSAVPVVQSSPTWTGLFRRFGPREVGSAFPLAGAGSNFYIRARVLSLSMYTAAIGDRVHSRQSTCRSWSFYSQTNPKSRGLHKLLG